MDFLDIVKSRYAAKSFDGKKIPQGKIDELMEIIRYAPSGFNIQPWTIKVITDVDTKKKIQEAAWNQPQIGTASHVLVFCADSDVKRRLTKLIKLMQDNKTPEASVKGFSEMALGFESRMTEEQKAAWAKNQTFIAMDHALLGAKALGLDSCPMEGFATDKVSEILKLPKNLSPAVIVPVGYANDVPRMKMRFSKKEVFEHA